MARIGTAVPVGVMVVLAAAAAGIAWYVARPCRAGQHGGGRGEALPTPEQIAALPADGGGEFNRLIHEKSPYLLQHARNPVDWYPWGAEAFAKASKEGKPIFLSVGYSTCHWCHVMERESFERADVAAILNEHYVAIKVDREERPDIDQIYMLATQLMTGRGGWPNSLWLTPAGKCWYAGTYFPREDHLGRPGFKTILTRLAEAWKTKRKDVVANAARISEAVKRYSAGDHVAPAGELSRKLIQAAVGALGRSADRRYGGFGGAPKFPPHGSLRLLFREYRRTKDAGLLKPATATLDAMARGGIHDHVGGGFHRYSTDARWFLPHFEKMLYDNAQLARAYVDGYLLTGREDYALVARDTYEWVLREMTDKDGGFYSALDADSEGEEGKFYLWSRREILEILGAEEGEMFCGVYGVEEGGNFSDEATGHKPGTSILYLREPLDAAAAGLKTEPAKLRERLAAGRRKLLARRVGRVWPHLDDKVLMSWNALMIGSLAYGGGHLKEPRYVAAAEKAAAFILDRMRKNGRLLRTYRQGAAKLNAYLDDYAFLADAMLDLHETTGRKRWLEEAESLTRTMLKHHSDPAGGGLFFTAGDHEELLARTKDPMDRAVPSGNAVAARALVRLGVLTGRSEYLRAARDVLDAFRGFMQRVPDGTAGMLLATGLYLDAAADAPAGPRPDAGAATKPVAVAAFVGSLAAAPGRSVELAVRITIDEGWHVNSHNPARENLIATSLGLKTGASARLADVVYPEGRKVTLAFSPDELSVYEGTVWIRAKIALGRGAPAGPVKLELTVRTQACSDSACLTPQTHVLPLTVNVDPDAGGDATRHPHLFAPARKTG